MLISTEGLEGRSELSRHIESESREEGLDIDKDENYIL
jgi:hypothetical protein